MLEMLGSYAHELSAAGKSVIATNNERVIRQLRVTGITDVVGDRRDASRC